MKQRIPFVTLALLLAPADLPAAVILSDDFSTATGTLGGTTADVGGVWQATNQYAANGAISNNAAGGAALQAFAPVQGTAYTLTATVSTTGAGYIGIGFANKTEANWGSDVLTPNNQYRFSNSYTVGFAWMFNIKSTTDPFPYTQSAFAGPLAGATVLVPTGPGLNSATLDLKIILDATEIDWKATMYVNDVEFATKTYVGNGGLNAIDSVGFTNSGGGTGTISNFQLTNVPEPSAALLGGLGLLGLLRRRRI